MSVSWKQVLLDLPLEVPVAESWGASAELNELVTEAVGRPIDYPPWREVLLPEDVLCIVVANPLPVLNDVAGKIAERLRVETGVAVQLVVSAAAWETYWQGRDKPLPVSWHDPENQQQLAMLGVGAADEPWYINRTLFDADVVLPVNLRGAHESRSTSDCIVPTMMGLSNRDRFHDLNPQEQAGEIRAINQNLGTFVTCEVVLKPGGSVDSLWIGERWKVQEAAAERTKESWTVEIPRHYPLVVVSLEAPPALQSWDDIVNALISAAECSQTAAPLVVLTEVSTKPSREIRETLSAVGEAPPAQRPSRLQKLALIARSHPIFLASRHKQGEVESWGLGFVQTPAELERLVSRAGGGVWLPDGHQLLIQIASNSSSSE